MKRLLILFISFAIFSNLSAQTSSVKLLFNMDGDLRNPSFFYMPNSYNTNSLLFESHKDSVSIICYSNYSTEKDSFLGPILLTNDKYKNINPVGVLNGNGQTVYFQTNSIGKWNIAFRDYENNNWNPTTILYDNVDNDINPAAIKGYSLNSESIPGIVYQKGNSIALITKTDSTFSNKIIINCSDSLKYSYPAAIYNSIYYEGKWKDFISIAAIQTDINNNTRIIEKLHELDGNLDSIVVIDSGIVSNPQFSLDGSGYIIYNKIENSISSIYTYGYYGSPAEKLVLNDTLTGSFSNLKIDYNSRYIIGKLSNQKMIDQYPYIYNFSNMDSNFINLNVNYYTFHDTLISVKMNSPKADLQLVYYYPPSNHQINYLVWEDSVNGNIELLGMKVSIPAFGDVNEIYSHTGFNLNQNYPNPFNPSTTITYEIPISGLVQLKIFDILGREVAVLVNEVQTAGQHTSVFNSPLLNKNLSSGIYLYRLKFGSNILSGKMMLLK